MKYHLSLIIFVINLLILIPGWCSSFREDNDSITTSLKVLKLQQILDLTPPERLSEIKSLDLSKSHLKTIPSGLWQLTGLEELQLQHNELGAIPSELGRLTALKTLYLYNNKIKVLPTEIGLLQSLEILGLHSNQLTGLPAEIGNLKNLRGLGLHGNHFPEKKLSIPVENLPNLRQLSVEQKFLDPAVKEQLEKRGIQIL